MTVTWDPVTSDQFMADAQPEKRPRDELMKTVGENRREIDMDPREAGGLGDHAGGREEIAGREIQDDDKWAAQPGEGRGRQTEGPNGRGKAKGPGNGRADWVADAGGVSGGLPRIDRDNWNVARGLGGIAVWMPGR